MIRRAVFLAALALPFAPAHAAEADAQLWLATTTSVDLGNDFGFFADAGLRFSDNRDGLYADYARGAVSYQVNDRISVAAGYVHVEIRADGHRTGTEERPFEQLDIDLGHGWSSRTRFEQSFVSGSSELGLRLRERIGWSHPLGIGDARVSLGTEAFFGLKSARGGEGGFRRLRSAATVSQPIAEHVAVNFGYYNQWSVRPGDDEVAHVASLTLAAHF